MRGTEGQGCRLGVLLLLAASGAAVADGAGSEHRVGGKDSAYPRTVVLRWVLNARNTADAPSGPVTVRCLAPLSRSSTQSCRTLHTSVPSSLASDALGRLLLTLQVPDLPPFGAHRIVCGATVDIAETPVPLTAVTNPAAPYAGPDPRLPVEAPEVLSVAQRFVALAEPAADDAICAWVANNLRHTGYSENDRGAVWALRHREGDCSEFASVTAALCRARGLTARRVLGVVVPSSAVIGSRDLHVWVEALEGQRWMALDPLKRAEPPAVRVVFAVLHPAAETWAGQRGRLVACDNRVVEVRWNQ